MPKGVYPHKKGFKHPPEFGRAVSARKKGKPNPWMQGEKNWRWKGGICTPERIAWHRLNRRLRVSGNGGSHTVEEWLALKEEYNFTCPACLRKEPEVRLTVDHITPVCKGGTNNIDNIQPLCKPCNSTKHAKTIKYEKLKI